MQMHHQRWTHARIKIKYKRYRAVRIGSELIKYKICKTDKDAHNNHPINIFVSVMVPVDMDAVDMETEKYMW